MAAELEQASAARDEQYNTLKSEHDLLVEQCAPFRYGVDLILISAIDTWPLQCTDGPACIC